MQTWSSVGNFKSKRTRETGSGLINLSVHQSSCKIKNMINYIIKTAKKCEESIHTIKQCLFFEELINYSNKAGTMGQQHRVIICTEDKATQIVFDWKFHEF